MAIHTRLREFKIALGSAAAAWRLAARAAQPGRLPTIGFLGPNTRSAGGEWIVSLVQRLRELGWIAGRNVVMAYRWKEGRQCAFPGCRPESSGRTSHSWASSAPWSGVCESST